MKKAKCDLNLAVLSRPRRMKFHAGFFVLPNNIYILPLLGLGMGEGYVLEIGLGPLFGWIGWIYDPEPRADESKRSGA